MKLTLKYNRNLGLNGITSEELLKDYDKIFNIVNDYVVSKSNNGVIETFKIFSYKNILANLDSPVFLHKKGGRNFTEKELKDIKEILNQNKDE